MATRGRKPSPIELKLVRGNPGKRPLNITARVLRQDEALACDRPTMLLEEQVVAPNAQVLVVQATSGLQNAVILCQPRGLLKFA